MKTLTDGRVIPDLRNQTYQASILGSVTPLQNSLLPGSGRSKTCYVILEEQAGDVAVDNNGNDQQSETMASTQRRRLSATGNRNYNGGGVDNASSTCTESSAHLLNLNESINRNCDNNFVSTSSKFNSLSNNSAAATTAELSNLSSLEPSCQDPRPDTDDRSMAEVKSGHLVMIVSDNISKCALLNSDKTTSGGPSTSGPQRCPVIVKIGGRGYDKYAIISSTRRRRGSQSVCLKLKHSQASQSASSPCRFTVMLDGDDGKTFTFEAGSAELASEWTRFFSSSVYSPNRRNNSLNQTRGRARQPARATTASTSLSLSHVPLMPVLSESLDEDDE